MVAGYPRSSRNQRGRNWSPIEGKLKVTLRNHTKWSLRWVCSFSDITSPCKASSHRHHCVFYTIGVGTGVELRPMPGRIYSDLWLVYVGVMCAHESWSMFFKQLPVSQVWCASIDPEGGQKADPPLGLLTYLSIHTYVRTYRQTDIQTYTYVRTYIHTSINT